jgi:hypothetical protein
MLTVLGIPLSASEVAERFFYFKFSGASFAFQDHFPGLSRGHNFSRDGGATASSEFSQASH